MVDVYDIKKVNDIGPNTSERGGYSGLHTDFMDVDLDNYSISEYPSPQSTMRLVEEIRKNKLFVFGGTQTIGKHRMLRHLAYVLSRGGNGFAYSKLPVKEWVRNSDLQRLENVLDENKNPTVFILPQIRPEDVHYNLLKLQNLANARCHYIIVSTDTDHIKWSLNKVSCKTFWRDWKPAEMFDKSTLTRHLLRNIHRVRNSLPEWIESSQLRLTGQFCGLVSLSDLAERLKTPDQINMFVCLLRFETKKLDKVRIEHLVHTALSEERILGEWFDSLAPGQQMLALALALFEGFYDDQFFAALELLITNIWRPRNPEQPFYDYADLELFAGYFNIINTSSKRTKIEVESPEQHFHLLSHAYKKHRRNIKAAIPLLIQLVAISPMGSNGNMGSDPLRNEDVETSKGKSKKEEGKADKEAAAPFESFSRWQLEGPIKDLFGADEKCNQVQRSISMVLSQLGLISIRLVDTPLLQLAASQSLEVQAVAARALANWRTSGRDEDLFELLKTWQTESHCLEIVNRVLEKRHESGSGHAFIRKTIVLTGCFAIRYDKPNEIHPKLKTLLIDLAKDEQVTEVFATHAIPLALTHHLGAMSDQLDDWMMNAWFIPYIGKGVAGHVSVDEEAAFKKLSEWQGRALCDEKCRTTDPRKPPRRHEALVACVAWAYGFMDYKKEEKAAWERAFNIWDEMLSNEPHPFVRYAVLGALGIVARKHFEVVKEKFSEVASKFPESEYSKVAEIVYDIYLSQRAELRGGDDSRYHHYKLYQVWVESERPKTQVEKTLMEWMSNSKNEGAQRIAIHCLEVFDAKFDKLEAQFIETKRKAKEKKKEKDEASAKEDTYIVKIHQERNQNSILEKFIISLFVWGKNYKTVKGLMPAIWGKKNEDVKRLLERIIELDDASEEGAMLNLIRLTSAIRRCVYARNLILPMIWIKTLSKRLKREKEHENA